MRALPSWLSGGAVAHEETEANPSSSDIFMVASTYVVDDCQIKLVKDSSSSKKGEVMNIMNICQSVHILTKGGIRRSTRIPTPMIPVLGGSAVDMLRSFCSWQLFSAPVLRNLCPTTYYDNDKVQWQYVEIARL